MFHPNQAFVLVQKLKSAPKGFRLGVKVELEKIFPICPKLLINTELYWPCIGPKARKRIPSNFGGQFAILGVNVLAFISNLGPNNKPKMLRVGPKFFGPLFLV
jgi:hypothetical protein